MPFAPIYAQHLASLYEPELLESLEGKTLLITGSSGLIGRFFVDSLLVSKADFRLILPARRALNFADSRVQSFIANICEPLTFPDSTKLDAIVHLASPASPAVFAVSPIATITLDVHATQNLLELASQHHAKFIFMSSSEIYGESAKILTETDMGYLDCMQPCNCYNESKRLAETLTQSFAYEKGTQSIVLRIPRTFGATFGAHDNRALSSFLRDCAMDRDIWLKSDGQQMYSFLYVGDCARAIAFALAKLPANQAYNVASEAMSLRDFALHVANLNPKVCLRIEKTEQIGITKTQHSILDTTKIKNYGFFPKFSLQEGLEWTYRILKEKQEKERE